MANNALVALGLVGVGATALIVADKFWNVFNLNPNLVWFWERAPFVVARVQSTASRPAMFSAPRIQPAQAYPVGLTIPPTELVSVSTGGFINGQENARIGVAQAPRMANMANGKYR
jgi:hypothetical protein